MQTDGRCSINERMNLVFQDADIIPLFVQVRCVAHSGHHVLA
jgi:hypothetical protein